METKTTIFSKISNFLFLILIIFCLTFLWINYYIKSIKLSFISAILICSAFIIIYQPTKQFINKKKSKKNKELNDFNNFKLQISYCKYTDIIDILKDYLNIKNYKQISENHFFINQTYDLFFYDNNSNIKDIFRQRKSSNIKIFAFSEIKLDIKANNIDIEIINLDTLYKINNIANYNIPNIINIKKTNKYSLKDIFCIVLCKEKSKSYFWLGLLILFSSLLTPFNSYYIIYSTILFFLAIFSRFNPFFNK